MSLRDLGVWSPLESGHPAIGDSCWICAKAVEAGTRVALVPLESAEEAGSRTVEARIVCGTCHLRGREITTRDGRRIVLHVKDGHCSHPIVTTDGSEWMPDEVFR